MLKLHMKLKTWKGYNIIDLLLLGGGIIIIITTSIVFRSNWLTIVNSLLGICCVFMQAKGKIATQFIGVIWFVFYCFLSYQQEYYGETMLYATITIPLYIYGIIHWFAHRDKKDNVVIVENKINTKEPSIFLSVWACISVVVFFLLRIFANAKKQVESIAVSDKRYYSLSFVANACL